MKRSTVRLINAVAYRRSLARDLPDLEARLLALLEEGKMLRTGKWVVRREGESLLLSTNESPPSLCELPLAMQQK